MHRIVYGNNKFCKNGGKRVRLGYRGGTVEYDSVKIDGKVRLGARGGTVQYVVVEIAFAKLVCVNARGENRSMYSNEKHG